MVSQGICLNMGISRLSQLLVWMIAGLMLVPSVAFSQQDCPGNKEMIGTVAGAILGGLLGSQVG